MSIEINDCKSGFNFTKIDMATSIESARNIHAFHIFVIRMYVDGWKVLTMRQSCRLLAVIPSPNAIFQLENFHIWCLQSSQYFDLTLSYMPYCCGRQQPGNILIYINLNIEIASDKKCWSDFTILPHHIAYKYDEKNLIYFLRHTKKKTMIEKGEMAEKIIYINEKNGTNKTEPKSKPPPLRVAMNERQKKKRKKNSRILCERKQGRKWMCQLIWIWRVVAQSAFI